MTKTTKLLGFGAVCASAAFYACGSDDSPTNTSPDAGAQGLDASTTDGPAKDGTVATTDSSTPVDAGTDSATTPWCGAIDGGAVCATGQYAKFTAPVNGGDAGLLDSGAPTCAACPTTPLTCTTAVLTAIDGGFTFTPPKFNYTTKSLTFTLPAGQRQIVSITNATAVVTSNCFGGPPSSALAPVSVPAAVKDDTITFDLSATDASFTGPCGAISFTVQDACCTTSTVTVNAYWDSENGNVTNGSCPDGG